MGFFILYFYLSHQNPTRPVYSISQESKILSDITKKKIEAGTLPGLFSTQIAKQPHLEVVYSQLARMWPVSDAVARLCESVSSKARKGAVNTAVVILANLMFKH